MQRHLYVESCVFHPLAAPVKMYTCDVMFAHALADTMLLLQYL
jgi:hypothetical protein